MKSVKANNFIKDILNHLKSKTFEISINSTSSYRTYGNCSYSVRKNTECISVDFEFEKSFASFEFEVYSTKDEGKRNREFWFLIHETYRDSDKEWVPFPKINLKDITVEQAVSYLMLVFNRHLIKDN